MFTAAQKIAAKAYAGGEFAHVLACKSEAEYETFLEECGDTLFVFVMRELGDEDCEDLDEALRRMNAARDEIDEVASAIEREA